MKNIDISNNQIIDLTLFLTAHGYDKSIIDELAKSLGAESVEETDHEVIFTPARAFEKVSERTQAARIENDKRNAKQIINRLEIKCEGYEATIEALKKENEALNLQITNN